MVVAQGEAFEETERIEMSQKYLLENNYTNLFSFRASWEENKSVS